MRRTFRLLSFFDPRGKVLQCILNKGRVIGFSVVHAEFKLAGEDAQEFFAIDDCFDVKAHLCEQPLEFKIFIGI